MYEVTIIFKSFGSALSPQQKHKVGKLFMRFIELNVMIGDFTFDDGRLASVHILDAFFRAGKVSKKLISAILHKDQFSSKGTVDGRSEPD